MLLAFATNAMNDTLEPEGKFYMHSFWRVTQLPFITWNVHVAHSTYRMCGGRTTSKHAGTCQKTFLNRNLNVLFTTVHHPQRTAPKRLVIISNIEREISREPQRRMGWSLRSRKYGRQHQDSNGTQGYKIFAWVIQYSTSQIITCSSRGCSFFHQHCAWNPFGVWNEYDQVK